MPVVPLNIHCIAYCLLTVLKHCLCLFSYFAISSSFYIYYLYLLITINNRKKNFNNLTSHLNFRDCILVEY